MNMSEINILFYKIPYLAIWQNLTKFRRNLLIPFSSVKFEAADSSGKANFSIRIHVVIFRKPVSS
jgi:hypothetical protein